MNTTSKIEITPQQDDIEAMFERGFSDGLPVVPPTELRVQKMLSGTSRDPAEVVAVVPPELVACTVEKVAINAVLAGCKPEYLPVVLCAVEAACTDEFNIHGVLATTMPVGPVLVVNGPIRQTINMNSAGNLLGQGNRANSTIGRALQLVIRNVGGGKPQGVDQATQGNPAKIGFCFAEDEEGSAFDSLAQSRGFDKGVSTVTLFAGEGTRLLYDQKSRSAKSLVKHFAEMLKANTSPRVVMQMETMIVISPEHMARFRDARWDRNRFLAKLQEHLVLNADDLLCGVDGIAEGLPESFAGKTIAKFPPNGIHVVHGGGRAGLFSSVIAGWVSGPSGSVSVTKEVTL